MPNTKKIDLTTSLTSCAAGLTANYPATQTWVFDTKPYTRGDILNALQSAIAAAQKTKVAHDAWLAAVEEEKALLALLHPILAALKKALEAQWGASSTKMTEFGYTPTKPRVVSAETKAASAAKARATRAAKKAALAKAAAPASPEPAVALPVPPKTA